ncbi:hypothetical protein [Rhizobium leguminosarum]|uniref:hypothetical protein n=1 Tax=Rhizobium leguminosarum TaxID=384 RepID=UPI001038FD9E|nr:hypothetical protein [Rhizobium leguminosarum]TBZ94474.1 hypothetical protein E0H63_33570 [Rhizobium leguminosarum bv. viciae]
MMINETKARSVFKKVQQVHQEYRAYVIGGVPVLLSVEDLYRVVSQMYGLTINKTQVIFDGEFVRGLVERYPERVEVRVRSSQAVVWKRFTAVKELCHVIIDEKEDWSTDGVETIRDLLVEYFMTDGEEAAKVSQSEMLAEIAAIELLYPFEYRDGDLKKLAAQHTTIAKIADQHGIPGVMVGRALEEHYHANVASMLWTELDEAA